MLSHFLLPARWPADCLCLVYFLCDLLSEWESGRGLSWDEAWLYQTTITLHPHSICTLLFSSHREGACAARVFVYFVLSCFYFEPTRVRVKEKRCICGRGKRKMGEGKGEKRHVYMIQPLHLTQVPFAPYCLSHCWKKNLVIYQAWRGSWSLLPWHGSLCVCLCVCLVCLSACVYILPFRQP